MILVSFSLSIIEQIFTFLQCHTFTVIHFMNGAGVCWDIKRNVKKYEKIMKKYLHVHLQVAQNKYDFQLANRLAQLHSTSFSNSSKQKITKLQPMNLLLSPSLSLSLRRQFAIA